MNNLTRYYNQNRKTIWLVIVLVAFLLVVIQLFNNFYKRQNQVNNEQSNTQISQEKDYSNESQAMVQGSITSKDRQEEYGALLEEFLNYCVEGNPNGAYSLLSNNCKEKLYPSLQSFETNYYSTKFDSKKNYDFQLWSSVDNAHIYLVRIYDDMLSTGIASTQDYIQDYLSIVEEDNVYRLNISGYVITTDFSNRQRAGEADDIKVVVNSIDSYMDYEIYNITVQNYSENRILLSSDYSNEGIMVKDDKGNNFDINSIEINEEDLIVNAKQSKELNLRFLRSYSTATESDEIVFNNIVKNYDDFVNNRDEYKDTIQIKVDL